MRFLECLKSAGKVLHGTSYLWSMMKKSSVSRMQRFMYSQILCYVLERSIRTQRQILRWIDIRIGSLSHHNTEPWTQLTENRRNSSGIFSHDSLHCSASKKSNSSSEQFQGRMILMTSNGEVKTMKRNVLQIPHLSLFARRFSAGPWSFFGSGSETKWYSTYDERLGGECNKVAELMMIKFGESGHPVFRATSPLFRGTLKSKVSGKLSMHFGADGDTNGTLFRIIISVNQPSIYGAV